MSHSNLMHCAILDKTPIPDALCDLGQDCLPKFHLLPLSLGGFHKALGPCGSLLLSIP